MCKIGLVFVLVGMVGAKAVLEPKLSGTGIKLERELVKCEVTSETVDWDPIVSVDIWADIIRSVASAKKGSGNG